MSKPITITAANWAEHVTSEGTILIDLWAAWCGPCRRFAPVFEAAATRHPDLVFGKVDTEAEQALAAALQITSIPTLIVIRDGVMVYAQPGALPETALEDLITQVQGLDMDTVRTKIAARQTATT
jgi:thioredoxin 1